MSRDQKKMILGFSFFIDIVDRFLQDLFIGLSIFCTAVSIWNAIPFGSCLIVGAFIKKRRRTSFSRCSLYPRCIFPALVAIRLAPFQIALCRGGLRLGILLHICEYVTSLDGFLLLLAQIKSSPNMPPL